MSDPGFTNSNTDHLRWLIVHGTKENLQDQEYEFSRVKNFTETQQGLKLVSLDVMIKPLLSSNHTYAKTKLSS